MATTYDITFLRLAMRDAAATLEKNSALRCLQVIDEQSQQGVAVTAMEVAVRMGYLGESTARHVDEQARAELIAQQSGLEIQVAVPGGRTVPPTRVGAVEPEDEYYDLAINGEGLDDFELGPKLGRGPVGASYLGRRKSDGARCAVKVISRRFQSHPDILNRVMDHLRGWQAIEHAHVAGVLGMGLSNGRDVVVYELAAGRSLSAHLAKHGPLSASKALRVIYELALGLATGQEKGLVCGDIRADKVYFDKQHCMLVDVGLARASALANGWGRYGLAFGHPAYLAPEVLQEPLTQPTPQTDVYALGILLYEMLCGQPPFVGEPIDMLNQHFDAPLPPPPDNVTFSTTIASMILKMTAKLPEKRIRSAGELVEAINRLLQGRPLFPTVSSDEPISADDWGRASQAEENVRHSENWTASAIEKAQPVGPSGFGEFDSQSTRDTGRHPVAKPQDDGGVSLREKLGRGAVGSAYAGTLGLTPVVIKVVSKKYAKYPELLRRIMKSVQASAGLTHPHMVRALKAMHGNEGRELIVYEKIDGQTLREVLDQGTLPASRATQIISQIAEALAFAGGRGIYHGDIRPEKVFIDSEGNARIADFGLAEAACLGAGHGRYGLHFGDPNYSAPEALQEKLPEPTPQTDVYALGVLYYQLACGRLPFTGKPRDVLKAHLTQPVPPPPAEVTIPGGVAEAILRMTAKDPARRLASAADVAELLAPVQGLDASKEQSSIKKAISVDEFILEVEEFDPASDPISADAWENGAETFSRTSGEWDKAKIAKAPKVGPEEWENYTASDDDRDEDGATLSRAIKEATLKNAIARGPRDGARGANAPGGESSKAPMLLVGVLILGLLGGVGFVLVKSGGGETVVDGDGGGGTAGGGTDGSGTGTDGGSGVDVDAEALAEAKKREEERKRITEELKGYRARVVKLVEQNEFREALSLKESLSKEAAASANGRNEVRQAETEIANAHRSAFSDAKRHIEGLVKAKKLEEAKRRVEAIRAWTIRPRDLDSLLGMIKRKEDEKYRLIKSAKLPAPLKNVNASRNKLKSTLKGDVILFPEGGFQLSYPDAGSMLVSDLVRLQGRSLFKAERVAVAGMSGNGVRIKAEKEPLLLGLKAPFQKVLQVRLGLVANAPLSEDARVSVLLGAREGRLKSRGLAWGLVPVEMRANGTLSLLLTLANPDVKDRVPLELVLGVSRGSFFGSLKQGKSPPRSGERSKLRGESGTVAIYVEGADVTITSLEVSGLVDPSAVQ